MTSAFTYHTTQNNDQQRTHPRPVASHQRWCHCLEYGLIATLLPKDQVISTECKVPAPDKKPQDGYAVVRVRERLIGIA